MRKHRIERNLAFPSEEFRAKVRTAAKQRGFRTEQAFLIAACEHELEKGDNTEAMDDLEARMVATLSNVAREVQDSSLWCTPRWPLPTASCSTS